MHERSGSPRGLGTIRIRGRVGSITDEDRYSERREIEGLEGGHLARASLHNLYIRLRRLALDYIVRIISDCLHDGDWSKYGPFDSKDSL